MRSRAKISLLRMPIILESPSILVMEIPERTTRKQLVLVDRKVFEETPVMEQVPVKEIPLMSFDSLRILN
ncbi:hypothetical protein PR1_71 [Providencia phage vB_PreS_PR1]|uniref:Uncharacterized protein n=1 Tax=Providencia phage vB_PreS_PR1 TaxID=1931407 RepID=A0A1S6KV86_9CAUD|nr:hypothetical protein FDH30_gp144 [Providencia phage vB_PreS_PR1]AQT25348.1 hypothetical protein PR1_71 [Providencia phage vB_PreS_PR1]